jgi:TatD DNase family protein
VSPLKKEKDSVKNGFVLHGTLKSFLSDKVYLNKIIANDIQPVDSAKIENNQFVFQGIVDYPERFILSFENSSTAVIFIVENTNFAILLDPDQIEEPVIKGSELNNKLNEYKLASKNIFKKIDYLFPRFQKARLENDVKKLDEIGNELKNIETWLNQQQFCAIGEIGIDLYWDKTFFKQQQEAFKIQINWAKERNLPFVIHCRDSFNEIFEILDELNDENMRGIFHCFTGNLTQATKVIEYGGFKLGIGGVVTFKNSGLEEVLKQVDINHLVLETDSPYLAPVPFRGKRNESSYIINVAEKLSDIYQIPIEKIAEITTKNSVEVFGF